jgi:hypothetical protein
MHRSTVDLEGLLRALCEQEIAFVIVIPCSSTRHCSHGRSPCTTRTGNARAHGSAHPGALPTTTSSDTPSASPCFINSPR